MARGAAVPTSLWWRSGLATLMLPGVVVGLIPYWLLHDPLAGQVDLGYAPWWGTFFVATGLVVYVLTTWAFGQIGRGTPAPWDPPHVLVRSGLHAWVRNPMYIGVLLAIVGEALLAQSKGLLVYAGVVALLFRLRVVGYEEPRLRKMFGRAFDQYVADVPRWLPAPPRHVRWPWRRPPMGLPDVPEVETYEEDEDGSS
jgi:protein-S-isoprenylcysteine O-methyltransferase Ste14